METFEECQRLLRETVHRLALQIKENVLKRATRVKDFSNFYSYFRIFIEELSKGALSQRIPKVKTNKKSS